MPPKTAQETRIRSQVPVRGDNHDALGLNKSLPDPFSVNFARIAIEDKNSQVGCPPEQSLLPLEDDRCWTNNQMRCMSTRVAKKVLCVLNTVEQGSNLHGFTKTHFITKNASMLLGFKLDKPFQACFLKALWEVFRKNRPIIYFIYK